MQKALVVLSYNHPLLTQFCLESVLATQEREQFFDRLFLVHNGSSLENRNWLMAKFPQFEHLILEDNRHFSGGANFGLKHAAQSCEWMLFLSNDIEIHSFPRLPQNHGLHSPQILRRQTQHLDSWGATLNLTKAYLRHIKSFNPKLPPLGFNQKFYVPGAAFWIDRETLSITQGFDEKLGSYWEDVDLSLRTQLLSIPLGRVEGGEIRHKIGKTCHKKIDYTLFYFQRNRRVICWRYCPVFLRPILAIYLCISWTQTTINLVKKKRWKDLSVFRRALPWDFFR